MTIVLGGPTTTEEVDWHEEDSPQSAAYDDYSLLQLVHATIEDVSVKEGISYDRVVGVLERREIGEVDWQSKLTNCVRN